MFLLTFPHVGIRFPRLTISIYSSFILCFTFLLHRSSVFYWCTVRISLFEKLFSSPSHRCLPLNMAESTQDNVTGTSSAASVESSGPPLVTPDSLIISSAIRDGIPTAMLPVEDCLHLLSSALTQLTSKVCPPSHLSGPGPSSIDVLTPPFAFTRLGVASATPRAPPSHSYELRASLVRPSHFGLRTSSSTMPVSILADPRSLHGSVWYLHPNLGLVLSRVCNCLPTLTSMLLNLGQQLMVLLLLPQMCSPSMLILRLGMSLVPPLFCLLGNMLVGFPPFLLPFQRALLSNQEILVLPFLLLGLPVSSSCSTPTWLAWILSGHSWTLHVLPLSG